MTRGTEDLIRGWQSGLAATNVSALTPCLSENLTLQTQETFSRQTRVLNSLDATLSRQRKSINSIQVCKHVQTIVNLREHTQTDLCGLSAAQYRLKFQLETLENYQSDLEVALAKIEEDTHELVRFVPMNVYYMMVKKSCRHGPGAVQLDRNDRLFCFAESMSAQLKDVCEKIQDVSSMFDEKTVRELSHR